MLPPALAILGAFRQFILCTLPGKIPVSPVTGQIGINAHDTTHHVDAPTAYAAAARTGHAVSFVLTADDPMFCLDIDGALQSDNTWSPLALSVIAALHGAAVEVSQSGCGLHIWGMYTGTMPDHACKNTARHLELYHTDRFICLGRDATGNASTDCTSYLPAVVSQWFIPTVTGDTSTEWTTEPVPEWRGPTDDDVLVSKMLASRGNPFGDKVHVRDLWLCNVPALIKAWPRDGGYDASSADAALASHLSFWTGKNCERMARLLRMSGLARDKHSREDYMQRTILNALGLGGGVLQERELPAPTDAVQGTPTDAVQGTPTVGLVQSNTFANMDDQLQIFRGCVYVVSLNKVFIPGGHLLDAQRFNATIPFNRYTYMLDAANEKTTRKAFEAFTQSQGIVWPQAQYTCFRPELPPGTIVDDSVNTYWPIVTPSAEGGVGPFLHHIERLLPDATDRAVMLAYMAAVVQYPGDKFQWWPLVQGCEGNGKSLLLEVLEYCVGARYCHRPNAAEIAGSGGKFTGWLDRKILIGIEEIRTSHRTEVLEILKPIVTNSRIEIQQKGVDQFTGDNRANGVLFSNHKDAITKTARDRRYAIFYTAQQEPEHLSRDGMTGDYFPTLYRWLRGEGLAHLNHWLRAYRIPAELNPALRNGGQAHRAPRTSSTDEAIVLSMGKVEQEVLEAIAEHRAGFCGGWISSIELDVLMRDKRIDALVPRIKRPDMLRMLGYEHHPGLHNGRASSPTTAGQRPVLYVKIGHPAGQVTGGAAITRAYDAAQLRDVSGVEKAA